MIVAGRIETTSQHEAYCWKVIGGLDTTANEHAVYSTTEVFMKP